MGSRLFHKNGILVKDSGEDAWKLLICKGIAIIEVCVLMFGT